MWSSGKLLIVHGNGNRGEILTSDAIDRCQTLIKFYRPGNLVIITGGIFKKYQQGVAVSHAMRSYIIENSAISSDHIIVEDKSRTTLENVELLQQRYDKFLAIADEIVYITSGYHVPRCQYIWDNIVPQYKRVIICPAKPWQRGLTLGKILVEIIGLAVVWCYLHQIIWPENLFRRLARTV